MRVTCELLGNSFDLPAEPRRVVCLVSAATETLAELGCRDRLIGVSPYCSRYVEHLAAPVVGDYVKADLDELSALEPDLVLLTAGVQLPLARRCAAAGLPAYALPVPASRFGILENIVTVGALVDRIGPSRALAGSLAAGFDRLLASRGEARPRVYVELWFGRHPRTTGGRTFIHDLVELAGGENVFGSRPEGYLPLDLPAAAAARPEVAIFFSEPEYPVDHERLIAERGWDGPGGPRAIVSTVARGTNMIHDGPSFAMTAAWLARQIRGGGPEPGGSADGGAERSGTNGLALFDSAGSFPPECPRCWCGEDGMQRAVPEAGGNPARPRHCNGNETPSNATGREAAGKAGGVGGPKSGDDPAP